jgi:hypothetical protein
MPKLKDQIQEWLDQGKDLLLKADTEECERSTIRKSDDELQIVWAEVYTANQPDTHGHIMRPDEVRKLAWRFLANGLTDQVDVQHDNVTREGVTIIESFYVGADEPHPLYLPDSWVVACHVPDPELWEAIKGGEINGFSMQANVYLRDAMIEINLPDDGVVRGETSFYEGGDSVARHNHAWQVRFGPDGEFLGGQTVATFGDAKDHGHSIENESVTESNSDHNHRFSLIDGLVDLIPAGGS